VPTAVEATDDPAEVLDRAGTFLATDPVRHNVILTLLHNRVDRPAPGRYWTVETGREVSGVVLQSPLSFVATVTPMPEPAVEAVVDAIVEQGVRLPGVNGVAATAARFAGQWTERTKSSAAPSQGQRIYEVSRVEPCRAPAGACRPAGPADRELLIGWFDEFSEEATPNYPPSDSATVVDVRLGSGQLFLWDDGRPVAMTGIGAPVAGVARVGPVYTPKPDRNRGYASALVGTVSAHALASGQRCMLYTDLGNPVSNSVYRALGYRAVDEVIVYRFAEQGQR
jgi:predicted GNAT family acetyltransferase